MTLIDKETIRAEITRRKKLLKNGSGHPEVMKRVEGVISAYDSILSFLDTIPEQPEEMDNEEKIRNFFDAVGDCGFSQYDILRLKSIWEDMGYSIPKQEQPVLPGIDEEGIPGKDFIPVDWVDACERYGKWKIVSAEQPVDGLEEEMASFFRKSKLPYEHIIEWPLLKTTALHFYEFGKQSRPKTPDISVEEEIDTYIKKMGFGHGGWVDGLEDEDLRQLARHFAECGAEHLKK